MTAPRHLTVLTGASRGMGLALAQQLLLQPGQTLLTLSRQASPALEAAPRAEGATLQQWPQDLAQGAEAAARLEQWLAAQQGSGYASATLINNAGVIPRIGPLDEAEAGDIANALRVGLEAPMLLTAAFLRATPGWTGTARKVLNISSGLGRQAMAGQAGYCAAKAGMDHFSRCTALDEARRPNGAKVVSLAPGVIDTDMQVQLRAGEDAGFPDKGRFLNLKAQGLLASPADAAARVLAYLARADFGEQPVADVRD